MCFFVYLSSCQSPFPLRYLSTCHSITKRCWPFVWFWIGATEDGLRTWIPVHDLDSVYYPCLHELSAHLLASAQFRNQVGTCSAFTLLRSSTNAPTLCCIWGYLLASIDVLFDCYIIRVQFWNVWKFSSLQYAPVSSAELSTYMLEITKLALRGHVHVSGRIFL